MSTHSLVINFEPDKETARPEDGYWLRIIDDRPKKKPAMTKSQAAESIDNLFGLEKCEDTTGGQGTTEEMPQPEDVPPVIQETVGEDPCEAPDESGAWTCRVRVYRSHRSEPYRIICLNGQVEAITWHVEQVETVIAAQGKRQVTLDKPVLSGLSLTAGVELIGSSILWFGGVEYNGFIHLEYTSGYDLVIISLPGDAGGNPQTAHLVAFYHNMAIEADIEPPEIDEETRQALDCSSSYHADEWDKPARCLRKTIHHVRCSCFNHEEINSYDTEEEVTCPDYARCPAGFIGCDWYLPIRHVDEYVNCTEITTDSGGHEIGRTTADWEGADPDYYEQTCCDPPEITLPQCKERITTYKGGAEIEGGVDRWRAKYGEDVELIAVAPADGICGEHIVKQVVRAKNCCDEAPTIEWDSTRSIEVIADNSSGYVYVTGGRPPYTWSVRGSGFWLDAAGTIRDGETTEPYIMIFTKDACGICTVTVTDGCSSATGFLRATDGHWYYIAGGGPFAGECPIMGTYADRLHVETVRYKVDQSKIGEFAPPGAFNTKAEALDWCWSNYNALPPVDKHCGPGWDEECTICFTDVGSYAPCRQLADPAYNNYDPIEWMYPQQVRFAYIWFDGLWWAKAYKARMLGSTITEWRC